ncbi:MAG: hypothetical protein GC157_10015 [Frankiales bacterium]|nr:hypothetical protein [Frankiales bacterium]
MVSFLDAYLVTSPAKAEPLGVVRREGKVWRVFLLRDGPQPRDVFATRRDAGVWLLSQAS